MFRDALAQARAEMHEQHFRFMCEVADLRRQLEEARAELASVRELRLSILARQHAESELHALYRERAIQQAERAERDPALPLN
jgi:deoxyribodipyrimidine photolyase